MKPAALQFAATHRPRDNALCWNPDLKALMESS